MERGVTPETTEREYHDNQAGFSSPGETIHFVTRHVHSGMIPGMKPGGSNWTH
jgi:hypothetical protein